MTLYDENSQVRKYVEFDEETGKRHLKEDDGSRSYTLLAPLGTDPNVIYLKKIDPQHEEEEIPHA